jgi:hypothetical protein
MKNVKCGMRKVDGISPMTGKKKNLDRKQEAGDRKHETESDLWSDSPQQKLDQALQLYWSARDLKAAWLKQQHPEMTDKQIYEKVTNLYKYART